MRRLGLLLLALVNGQNDNARWLENLEQLAVFVGERGHPDVPLDHPLGKWLASTRASIRRGTLDDGRVAEFRAAGGLVHPMEGRWDDAHVLLTEFVRREGHADVPPAHRERGVPLAAWLRRQKREALEGLMAPNRIKMLEELGVTGLRSKVERKEDTWLKNFDLLARYVAQHKKEPGRAEVVEGKPLGTWLASQKVKADRGDLLPERAAKLSSVIALPSAVKSAPSWTWPGAKPSESVTIPPLGNKRSAFFTDQTSGNLATLPEWYSSCVHKKITPLQGSPGRFRDEQIYHVLCLLEDKLARKDLSPLVVVQIGSNDGDDAVREALIYARRHYASIPIKVVLVEPTERNFDRLKKVYSSTAAFQGSGFEAEFVHGAVCDDCCVDDRVKIYHPRWSIIEEWYQNAINFPEKHPKAFATPDGSWRQKWLYELNSLDPENLKKNFKNSEDITYDEIACFKASALLDAFAGGRADYVMIDVEGFDDSVVYSLDLGRHRPRLIAFESKVMQGTRPEALYDVVEFCSMRGYKAVGPVKANHVCVRDDRAPAQPAAPARLTTPPATPVAPATPPAEPKRPYYPAPPDTKPEPLPEAKRLTAPGTALGEADKKNNGVAEWYLTNFRVRFAREDGSWFDPDVEDFGGTPCPGCTAEERAP